MKWEIDSEDFTETQGVLSDDNKMKSTWIKCRNLDYNEAKVENKSFSYLVKQHKIVKKIFKL